MENPNNLYIVQSGDFVQLVSPSNKTYFLKLIEGGQLQTHRGVLSHDNIIGRQFGNSIKSHLGVEYILLRPVLSDLLLDTKRNTQIIYPKDIGYILIKLGIGNGHHVLEAGTGSGALTTAFAWAVGPSGKVTTYEIRAEMQNLARKNLARLGLEDRVNFVLQDIQSGFNEKYVDVCFLDIPNPYDYLSEVRSALMPGGPFGCILPTTNQVTRVLTALHNSGFSYVEVCEIMMRFYKPVWDRLRPTDRMVAHTGYLVFARSIG